MSQSGDTMDYERLAPNSPVKRPPISHLSGDTPVSRCYVPQYGIRRYKGALCTLIPFRKTKCEPKVLPVDKVGFFSYMSFSWALGIMCNVIRSRDPEQEDAYTGSLSDSSDINGQRLQHKLRTQNLQTGQLQSSMPCAVWSFVCTRVIIASLIFTLAQTLNVTRTVLYIWYQINFQNNGTLYNTGFQTNQSLHNRSLQMDAMLNDKSSKTNGTLYDTSSEINKTESDLSIKMNETVPGRSFQDNSMIDMNKMINWVVIITVSELLIVVLMSWSWSIAHRTAGRLRSAAMSVIFRKLMKTSVLSEVSAQQVVSFMTLDSQRLYDLILYGPLIIPVLLVCIYCSIALWQLSILEHKILHIVPIVLGVYVLVFPILYIFRSVCVYLRKKVVLFTSRRLQLTEEMITHMGNIKMASLEYFFSHNINEARCLELNYIKKFQQYDYLSTSIVHSFFTVGLVGVILLFSDSERQIKGLFPGIVLLFFHFKDILMWFWLSLQSISDARQALDKFKNILLLEDVVNFTEKPTNPEVAIAIERGCFTWISRPPPRINKQLWFHRKRVQNSYASDDELSKAVLTDIDFQAGKGKLIGVCGNSGSGKSSLLLAILGQLRKTRGHMMCSGSCAYVSQQPWVWSTSLKENVVFKEPFQNVRYFNAIHLCSLNEDLATLPGADETHIGEMKLSVGQRQRVALARAVYANKDIYLLDNPLSSVNLKKAAEIFDKCILSWLKGKTVIIVTQQIQFLNRCDEVYVLNKGRIVAHGPHDQLLNNCTSYGKIIKRYMRENEKNYFMEEEDPFDSASLLSAQRLRNVAGSVTSMSQFSIDDTARSMAGSARSLQMVHLKGKAGQILHQTSLGTYLSFLKQRYMHCWTTIVCLLHVLNISCIAGAPFLLCAIKIWPDITVHFMESVPYIFSVVGIFLSSCVWSFFFSKVGTGASEKIHNTWISHISQAPISLFRHLSGTDILDFFSLNTYELDVYIPAVVTTLIEKISWILTAIVILGFELYWTLIPLLIFAILCIGLTKFYRSAVLKIQKIKEESRISLRRLLVTTLEGRIIIQAFGKTKSFVWEFTKLCDSSAAGLYMMKAGSMWFTFWVQTAAVILVGAAAALTFYADSTDILDPGCSSLVMIYILQLGNYFQSLLKAVTEFEARLKKFAAVNQFVQGIENEFAGEDSCPAVSAEWPTDGNISFQDVRVQYYPGAPPALKGLTFKIKSGQKIGIIGKPGSGKKPIINALYRLTELSHGKICIDGRNIANIPLSDLRSSMAIVPTNPVLFTGTIRLNIDPKGQYTEEEILENLTHTGLLEKIILLPDQLNCKVNTSNGILTVGERQLLWLTRAALMKAKVVIIEESLAAVGSIIEKKVESAVKNLFYSSTVIIVAHRLTYVKHCQKVMVIEDGQVSEFDAPGKLYNNPNSRFSQMIGNNFETEF